MEAKHFVKKDFTVEDFLQAVSICNEDAVIFNAFLNIEYIKNILNKNEQNLYTIFEPIVGFYNKNSNIFVEYSFFNIKTKTLKDFKEFIQKENIDLSIPLNRDVEEGFIFSNYYNIVFNENIIVLC